MTNTHRVLAVDDDPDILGIVEEVLVDAGFQVISAQSGMAAIEYLNRPETDGVDLLLLDLSMPFVSGEDVLGAARATERWHDIPVVIMTASQSTPAHLVDAGIQGFIAKPFDIDGLVHEVARVLGVRLPVAAPA